MELSFYENSVFIGRLHVNFDILVIFISLYAFFMRRESVIRSFVIFIPRILTVWVTEYVSCVHRHFGLSGTRSRYPRTLSQPPYHPTFLDLFLQLYFKI